MVQGHRLLQFIISILLNNNFKLPSCIINIGGIANLSYWINSNLVGFDTGPGNCLMDKFMQNTFGLKFDNDGIVALKVIVTLI